MNCAKCGKRIPKARLKALPNTTTCVKCSEVQPKTVVTVWDDACPELVILDEEEAEEFRRLEQMDGRLNRLK